MDCNDSLYAGDPKLVSEVAKLVHTLLDQVMEHMKGLNTTLEVCSNYYFFTFSHFLFSPPSLVEETTVSLGSRAVCQVSINPFLTKCLPGLTPFCLCPAHSLFAHAELSEQTNMSSLLVNLWNLACKHKIGDGKMLVS